MHRYSRLLQIPIFLVILSGCGISSHKSSTEQGTALAVTTATEKPRYPEIPFPPSAQDVQVKDIEGTRVIWFDTSDSPAAIHAFYDKHLQASGWITSTSPLPSNVTGIKFFEYQNGQTNPSFQLSIEAPPPESTLTVVTLNFDLIPTQVLDKDGKSSDWRQEWPPVSIPSAMQPIPTLPLEVELSAAEQRWAAQAPRNYTVTTVATNSGFFAEDVPTECTTVLSVRDNTIDTRRYDPCPWWSADESKVANLFLMIKNPGAYLPSTDNPEACVSAKFDPNYGYPTFISLNCPDLSDQGLDISIRLTVE